MTDTLTIFKLSIKSSYSENKELPADTDFDTLQFYAHNGTIWRIKTYAVDSDIHVHQIPLKGRSVTETLDFLTGSTKEHYGDVLHETYTLDLTEPEDAERYKEVLTKHNLTGILQKRDSFLFWNPNNANYETKSNPLG